MDLLETILGARNGDAVATIAKQLGINADDAAKVLAKVAPALGGGLAKNSAAGGIDGLMKALKTGNHQRYLDDPALATGDTGVADGNKILGHILGSKDVSRRLASDAASETGVSDALIKQMLPMVAALAMGALSKKSAEGGDGNALGGLLESFLGGSGKGGLADDLIGAAGKLFRQ